MGRQPGEHGKQRSGEKAKGGMTMESLHRLQILITKEQYRWLKANSYTKAKSIGEIIRELIEKAMKEQ